MRLTHVRPSDEELRVILESGFVLREAGRLDDADAVFRGALELLPDSDVPRVALGTVELQRGRFAEAQALCEEALRVRPESLYARVHRAESLLFQRRRDEAEEELREVMAAEPDSPHARTARALLEAADLICATAAQPDAAAVK
ncbi:MAG: tetratricopeptide repeat protein [Pyrinomonadaceae bacterium]